MKKSVKIVLAFVVAVVFAASSAFAGDPPFSGFLGTPDVYTKLEKGPEDGAKLRWLKPGVDFKKYNKVMLNSIVFYLADDSDSKAIDPVLMKDMADSFNKELVTALKDKYPIVPGPGPDVVRLRFAITNIKQSRPVLSAVTSVVPVGLAISLVKKGVTGGWSGSGETATELMALDSTTNDVIAMAVDQQTAAFTERFSKYGSADDAFKFWSERVVKFMDAQRGK